MGEGEGTHYISMSGDVLARVLFSESAWTGVCFVVKKSGKGFNIPVWKGINVCLERSGKLL